MEPTSQPIKEEPTSPVPATAGDYSQLLGEYDPDSVRYNKRGPGHQLGRRLDALTVRNRLLRDRMETTLGFKHDRRVTEPPDADPPAMPPTFGYGQQAYLNRGTSALNGGEDILAWRYEMDLKLWNMTPKAMDKNSLAANTSDEIANELYNRMKGRLIKMDAKLVNFQQVLFDLDKMVDVLEPMMTVLDHELTRLSSPLRPDLTTAIQVLLGI